MSIFKKAGAASLYGSSSPNEQSTGGVLWIKILEGTLYRNTDIFGEMDPYVMI